MTILIIAAIWAIAIALLWMHGATRKPDPEWPEFDVLGEAGNRSRDGWVK